MNWSDYQKAVFSYVLTGTDNLLINAVAGSGKTAVIVECVKRNLTKDPGARILTVAFNKHIAVEMGRKLPFGAESKTMHSLGLGIGKQDGRIKIDKSKTWRHMDRVPQKSRGFINKIIGLAKANYISTDEIMSQYHAIALHHNLDEPRDFDSQDLVDTYKACCANKLTYDFDDMIFMPVISNLIFPRKDFVYIDEAQDLNPIQIYFIEMLMKAGARIIAVGDPFQAIYGFRGADVKAFESLGKIISAKELPLSICYRCAPEIVMAAQKIVPSIEPNAYLCEGHWIQNSKWLDAGTVDNINKEEFRAWAEENDWVLCRTTKPLVEEALKFIGEGKKATIKGRDIGKDLITVVEKIKGKFPSEEFLSSMRLWFNEQYEKFKRNDAKLQTLEDQRDTLVVLWESAGEKIISRIEEIFSDDIQGIAFATVHRSKGLEADRIFILEPGLMPHPMAKLPWQREQEANLEYVAITRAKQSLYWVQ